MPLDADLAQKILETAPTILYVYDVQRGRSVFQNRRIGELLGHPPQWPPLEPNEWTAFIHPEDAVRFVDHRERLRRIGASETLSWEFRMRDAQGQWRWFLSRDSLLSSDHDRHPLLVVGTASEITEQKQAEQQKELMAEEMRHRARNLVSIVQAIGRMSRPRNEPEINKHLDALMGRLLTLLKTGGIVLSSAHRLADLETVIRTSLSPFGADWVPSRISIGGPAVVLPERTAGGIALAIHELATNAVKYGALSVDGGTVELNWSLKDNEIGQKRLFELDWRERGGPPVKPPTSEGFGGMVIRQSIAHESQSRVTLDYASTGLRCKLAFQISVPW